LIPSQNCIDLVKSFEGCKLQAYQDQKGIWTIGYGATGGLIGPSTVWTQDQAENDLIMRLNACGSQVRAAVGLRVSQNQFDALVSLIYNVGANAVRGSKLIGDINGGLMAQAANEFLSFDHITLAGVKVVDPGLLRRREAERALFLK
jgi:lysozyme